MLNRIKTAEISQNINKIKRKLLTVAYPNKHTQPNNRVATEYLG